MELANIGTLEPSFGSHCQNMADVVLEVDELFGKVCELVIAGVMLKLKVSAVSCRDGECSSRSWSVCIRVSREEVTKHKNHVNLKIC